MVEVEAVLLSIVNEFKLEKENSLTEILGTEQVELSPNTIEKKKAKYPTLCKYSVPLGDRRVHSSFIRDFHRLNFKVTKSKTIYVDLGQNKETALVTIPKSGNLERMKRNERVSHWLGDFLDAISGGIRQNVVTR